MLSHHHTILSYLLRTIATFQIWIYWEISRATGTKNRSTKQISIFCMVGCALRKHWIYVHVGTRVCLSNTIWYPYFTVFSTHKIITTFKCIAKQEKNYLFVWVCVLQQPLLAFQVKNQFDNLLHFHCQFISIIKMKMENKTIIRY